MATRCIRANLAMVCVLGITLIALLGTPRYVQAVEYVELSPEQRTLCEKAAEERIRQLCLGANSVKGLKFPEQARELGSSANASQMAIFKPKGDGPFPALLLLHTCAAVDSDPQQMGFWATRAIENGYVVFVVDSWGQRGISEHCRTSPPGFQSIHMGVRTRDAYEALWHLSKFDFVDSSRVAALGFSNGGRVSYLLGSSGMAQFFAPGKRRFAATVAVYGQCFNREYGLTFLRSDVDRPLLSLLGALDEDADPKECEPRLQELKSKGVPVEWRVFPNTGHAWDQVKFESPRRFGYIGNKGGVLFAYDANIAEESRNIVFDYLARQFKHK